MATGTFTHSSQRTKTLKTLIKTHRNVIKSSNPGYSISLEQGLIFVKIWLSLCLIGCVRLARYCGKIYNSHLFSYRGLRLEFGVLAFEEKEKTQTTFVNNSLLISHRLTERENELIYLQTIHTKIRWHFFRIYIFFTQIKSLYGSPNFPSIEKHYQG